MSHTEPALSMAETAAAVGLSAERFRKVWQTWARTLHFPAPFKAPRMGRGTYAWRASAVEAWKAGRERAFGEGLAAPPPADPDAPPRIPRGRLQRERAELRRLMEA